MARLEFLAKLRYWLVSGGTMTRIACGKITSQYLNLAKNSSLAIAIGFPDMFAVNQTIANQTGQPVPAIALMMGTYLLMSLFTSLIMNIYNRSVQILER